MLYVEQGHGVVHDHNAYTPHAFPAYVSAIAALEAFINEQFLGPFSRAQFRGAPLWELDREAIERLDLRLKVVIIPQLLVAKSLQRDRQPFQDFDLLIRVRNDIVHFKMDERAPRYLAPLSDRGIALTAADGPDSPDYPWPHKLSSLEAIRWAHNTVCRMAHALVDLIPEDRQGPLAIMRKNFVEIEDLYADERLRSAVQNRDRRRDAGASQVSSAASRMEPSPGSRSPGTSRGRSGGHRGRRGR